VQTAAPFFSLCLMRETFEHSFIMCSLATLIRSSFHDPSTSPWPCPCSSPCSMLRFQLTAGSNGRQAVSGLSSLADILHLASASAVPQFPFSMLRILLVEVVLEPCIVLLVKRPARVGKRKSQELIGHRYPRVPVKINVFSVLRTHPPEKYPNQTQPITKHNTY
jgi:hypothetical protein